MYILLLKITNRNGLMIILVHDSLQKKMPLFVQTTFALFYISKETTSFRSDTLAQRWILKVGVCIFLRLSFIVYVQINFFEGRKADRFPTMKRVRDTNNWYCALPLFYRATSPGRYKWTKAARSISVCTRPVHLHESRCIISVDMSGSGVSRRGIPQIQVGSAMRPWKQLWKPAVSFKRRNKWCGLSGG